MADNRDIGISVTGDISDVDGALDTLLGKIDKLTDKVVNIEININDQGLNAANDSLEEIGVKSEVASTLVKSNMEEATSSVDELGLVAIASGNDISTSMSSTTPAIEGVTSSAKDASTATNEVGKQGLEAGQEMEYGFAQAALAIVGMTAALEGTAEAIDKTNVKFGKMASATIPESELRDMVAYLTHADFPTDEALTYIKTLKQLGVTSEQSLQGGADDFHKIRSAVGTTEEQVVKFSNSMRVMGVDLDNIDTAFNAIAYAQANIVGGFDTYVAWMQKYDATFKEMGLNIDQTAVLIAAATKKFGGGRAAYQGLNEAIKESNGDLSVLEEKLGMQPGALSRASEETAKYGGKIERNSEIADEHTTILQKLWAALDDLGTKYGDSISMLTSFGAIIATALGAIFVAIPGAFRILDSLWNTEWEKWWKTGVQNAINKVKDAGSRIGDTIKGWMGWGDDAAKAAENVGSKVTGGGAKAGDDVFKAAENIGKSWGKGSEGAMAFMDEATGKMRYFYQYTDGRFAEIFKDGKAPKFAEESAKNIGTGFSKGLSGVLDTITSTLNKTLGEVPSRIINILKSAKLPKLTEVGDLGKIGSLLADMIPDGFLKALPSLGGKIAGKVGSIIGMIGGFIIDGLANAGQIYEDDAITAIAKITGIYAILEGTGLAEEYEKGKKMIQDLNDKFGLAIIPGFSKGGSIKNLMSAIFGEDTSANIGEYLTNNIERPFRQQLELMGQDWVGWFSDTFRMLGGDIWKFLTGEEGTGGEGQGTILDNILGGLESTWNQIVSFFTGLPASIQSFVSGLSWESFNAWLDSAIFSIGSFAKTLYELPGNIYNALVNLPNTITGIFNGVIEYLKNLPNQLVIYATNIWNGILNGLKTVESSLKNAILVPQKAFNDFVNFLLGLPAKLYSYAVSIWTRFVEGINSTVGRIKGAVDNVVSKINDGIQWVKDLPGNMYNWGANVIKSWKDGIVNWVTSNWEGFKKWLDDKLKNLFAGWESHSPPIVGPLKNIDEWGAGIGTAWLEGIGTGIDKGKSYLDSKLQSLVPEFQASDYALNSNSVSEIINPTPTTFQIEIKNEFGDVNASSREEAEKAVKEISSQTTETTVESLEKALINNGYSIWNSVR
ncbi:MAG: Phage-related minor tail protein [Candidatus Methanofastidiosum methylothiophilum]|uniref:Phage-related minor tail protein n=1 Tax=Candidatus Methanofastidiosum methylothiophilum TaxID=1705564 RepID=A0A150J3P0_9EURY|nr:MAG: Phage-related minor tail protein [Candidatus Methanofastidiosum methylthiophilus]